MMNTLSRRRTLLVLAGLSCLLLAWAARSVAGDPPAPAAGGAAVRFLALGDSYTIGEHVDAAKRWPVQLAALLKERGIDVGEPQIVARTGWTTDELAAGIERAAPQGPYALVTLQIGVNNQFRYRSAQEYRGQFHSLLERAVGLAGGQAGHVVVLSIPDWGVTPFANGRDRRRIAAEIDRLNAINREEAKQAGARYVDITPESREASDDATRVASDGLHPSAKAYAAWARLALPQAVAALAPAAPAPAKPGAR